ncbi:MAG: hypothetical protein GWP06_17870 [Actinobacteria bacterium]|nr:hypothetical protein [Actinomycetota bacterium]
MKHGNWIPISKGFLKHLPKDRAFTKLEAAFSLQMDYDSKNAVTITGYANLWRWSRKKVRTFFNTIGVNIIYPENTKNKQNQKGQISIQIRDRSGEKKGQINFIDNKEIQDQKDRCNEKKEQIRDRSGSTTRETRETKDKNLCPQENIVDLYHTLLPGLPKVKVWSETRQRTLRARWNEAVPNNNGLKSNCIEWWEGFFRHIGKSDFLMGRITESNRKPFRPNLEWFIQKSNFINILEGKYH